MAAAILRRVGVCLLLALLVGGCESPKTETEEVRDEFQESRRITELNIRIQSLQLKLDQLHEEKAELGRRYDRLEAELMRERNLRQQQSKQNDLTYRDNQELKARLQELATRVRRLESDLAGKQGANSALVDRLAGGEGPELAELVETAGRLRAENEKLKEQIRELERKLGQR